MEAELVYYRRRWADESTAAVTALDPRVRNVHLELARRYLERVRALEAQRANVHLRLVSAA